MKPMVYRTKYGIAEIQEYGDAQIAVYDDENIPSVVIEDDDAFVDWGIAVSGRYVGNFRKGELGRPTDDQE